MRELQLWDADDGADHNFADVLEFEAACRFSNCTHQSEPDCAVRTAVDEGLIAAGRVENYLKIQSELDRLAEQQTLRGQLDVKRRVKVATRAYEKVKRTH
jgi:ribosome biogenesis GTPase